MMRNEAVMEKQKLFLILALIGALVIFLQQDSLQITNRHLNKSTTNSDQKTNNQTKNESWQTLQSECSNN